MKELRKRASERHRKKEGADRKKGRKRARRTARRNGRKRGTRSLRRKPFEGK